MEVNALRKPSIGLKALRSFKDKREWNSVKQSEIRKLTPSGN